MSNQPVISVLGGGSFGTALANTVALNGSPVYLWLRDSERAEKVQQSRENTYYLPGYPLCDKLLVTDDLSLALGSCDLLFISVPSASFRHIAQLIKPYLLPTTMVVSTTKGIDGSGFTLMSQILEQEIPEHKIGVLSGPNFAKEMIQEHITGSVIASDHTGLIELAQQVLRSPTFRVYSNDDRYGVELAGALKNIYAIIIGMAEARECGHNTLAMIMTRALAEMGRFSYKLGGNPMTFLGLAGVGDLILTCGSNLSRNYRLGYALGSGKSYKQALAEIGQVVEGINTLRLVKQKSDEMQISMPLVSALYSLVFDREPVDSIIRQLMSSDHTCDVDFTGAQPTIQF